MALAANVPKQTPYYEKLREDLRQTLTEKSKLEQQLSQIEENIYALEDAYLSSTSAAGNIVVGFEGYMKAAATSHAPVAPIPDNSESAANGLLAAPTPYTGTFPINGPLLTGGLLTAGLSTAGFAPPPGARKHKILDEHRIFSNASVTWRHAKMLGNDPLEPRSDSGAPSRRDSQAGAGPGAGTGAAAAATPATAVTALQVEDGLEASTPTGQADGDTPLTARPRKGNKKKGKRDAPADEEEASADGRSARPGKRLKISFAGGTAASNTPG